MSDYGVPSGRSLLDLGVLRMSSSRAGGLHVIALAGDFELATCGKVERELELAAASDAAKVVLDLSSVAFMDSCGLRTVLAAVKRLDGRLQIVPGPRSVQRVFEICGFGDMLPFAAPSPRISEAAIDHSVLSAQIARAAVARRASQAVLASAVRGLRSHDRHRHLRVIR